MSLTQLFPEFTLAAGAYKDKRAVPLFMPPGKVEFRNGGDLAGVIEALQTRKRVEIEAATGAGKSSRLPLELARVTGRLVVHVVPHYLMAVATHRYRVKVAEGVPAAILHAVADPWPASGVVVVSAGLVVAKWLQAGGVDMPECYVLQDESHESGAASAVMRALTSVSTNVLSYAAMTATHGPAGSRRMEMSGTVRDQFYEPEAFADPWSVEEDGAPWAVTELFGHALIFEDDRRRAMALVEAYNSSGAMAYRLHARMSARDFLGVLDQLENDRSGVACVLVADSTFRSSHTFPVQLVLDSGLVKRVVVENGKPVVYERPIYEFEAVQSKARGGRLRGLASTYWRPRGDLQAKMCDLEQTDVEAAAVIFRALGFTVPKWAQSAKMAAGKVPKLLHEALSGPMPLAVLREDLLVGVEERSATVEDAVAVGASYMPPTVYPVAPEPEVRNHFGGFGEELDSAVDVLRTAMVSEEEEISVRFGEFYCARGIVTSNLTCVAFPEGVDSVKRLMVQDRSGTLQYSWSANVRSVAVNALLNSYNRGLLEVQAYAAALNVVKKSLDMTTEPMRRWVTTVAERMSVLASKAEFELDMAAQVAYDFCSLASCNGLFDDERRKFIQVIMAQYQGLVPDTVDARPEELARMRQWVSDTAMVDGPKPVGFSAVGVGNAPRVQASPAAARYSGHNVPKYLLYAAGRMKVGSSTSSSSSGRAQTRYIND